MAHQTPSLIWLMGCLLIACVAFAPRSVCAAERPNIVVFVADDVDWKDFGCYGNDAIRTPTIDSLAESGLLCRNAFLTTSSCSPTRISVLTGKYPHATGAEDLHMPLPDDQVFVSTHLKRAGYFTGHMLKTHYGPNGNRQFDWYGRSVDEFPAFLNQRGDRPFFLWVGFREAHRPYQEGAVDPPHDPAAVHVPPYLADTPETRRDLALYYDEVARMDGHIAEMLAELDRRGLRQNTLVVFFADNGRPFPRAKGTLYDAGIGTPLVFAWPGTIEAGSVHEGLASVIDLAPTFLAAAGLETPGDMQGRSMLPILKDPALPGQQHVFSERNWHNCDQHMRSVRTRRYKLIRNAYLDVPYGNPSDVSRNPSWDSLQALKAAGKLTPGQLRLFEVPRPRLELYDLEKDPWEFDNLADDSRYASVRNELEAELERWSVGSTQPAISLPRAAVGPTTPTG